MSCKYYKICEAELKSKDCMNGNFIILCSNKLKLKKEYELRQESIKRLCERANKLKW